jgi:hypothetical protein
LDPSTGYYVNNALGLYYEPNANYYYNIINQVYYTLDPITMKYLRYLGDASQAQFLQQPSQPSNQANKAPQTSAVDSFLSNVLGAPSPGSTPAAPGQIATPSATDSTVTPTADTTPANATAAPAGPTPIAAATAISFSLGTKGNKPAAVKDPFAQKKETAAKPIVASASIKNKKVT